MPYEISGELGRQLRMEDTTAQKLLERILRCVHRANGIVYLGTLAVEAGVSITKAETLVEVLVESGDLRRATPDELERVGAANPTTSIAYVVAGRVRLNLANW